MQEAQAHNVFDELCRAAARTEPQQEQRADTSKAQQERLAVLQRAAAAARMNTPWGAATSRATEAERTAVAARDYEKAESCAQLLDALTSLAARGEKAQEAEAAAVAIRDWPAAAAAKATYDEVVHEIAQVTDAALG